jgi:uroporphyrinogen III methyltransferase / synthase
LGAAEDARSEASESPPMSTDQPRATDTAGPSDGMGYKPGMGNKPGTGPKPGRVHLVGAGPGDPGLLTARALELIERADTILYDRLIPSQALDGARANAELLFVGKEGGGESVPQERTQALMIERARAGREVVRLKGGDPFVFGRGGEEALALREAGIEFTVVPGVTAGVAAAAYAGIPVTHRGRSTGVALVTGHEDPEKPEQELDWGALAAFPGTLVFYMGVRALSAISRALIDAGRSAEQPVAIVQRGTLPTQRMVQGTLATIADAAHAAGIQAPAITVVGDVAALAPAIGWWTAGPLAGLSVAVTRARAQASELARRLGELGATVVQTPAIRTRALDGPPLDPSLYDLICVASPNAVEHLFARIDDGVHPPGDARALARSRIAAIGPATARALAKHGVVADVIPERAHAESLLEALTCLPACPPTWGAPRHGGPAPDHVGSPDMRGGLQGTGMPVSRVLIPRARDARDVLPDGLRAHGAQVDVIALYETLPEPLPAHLMDATRTADYVTFASSSAVNHFFDGLRAALDAHGEPTAADAHGERTAPDKLLAPYTKVVSIGPLTTSTLREHGIEPHVQATRHDIDGLVDALLADALTH